MEADLNKVFKRREFEKHFQQKLILHIENNENLQREVPKQMEDRQKRDECLDEVVRQ